MSGNLEARVAVLEERDVHTATSMEKLERKLDKLIDSLEQDRKSNKTAFYALVGTIVTALSSGSFLLLSLVLK